MGKLIINADDFGYSKAVNRGIIETYQNGILTSTTMMANMSGFEDGCILSKENSGLAIGVHLSLTCGYPILKNVDGLVDSKGKFKPLSYYKTSSFELDLEQLYDEWDAQIQKIVRSGINISHLDSHHYIHSYGTIYSVIVELAKKYRVPVRNCYGVHSKIKNPIVVPSEGLWNFFNYAEMKDMKENYSMKKSEIFDILKKDAEKYSHYSLFEAVVHPGYLDTDIWYGSTFNLARIREVEMLCDLDLKKLLDEFNYELINYHEYKLPSA